MPSPPLAPPLDGSICILPGFLDFHAEHNPDLPWALLASDQGTAVGSVSFLELANATHRVAHALRPELAGPDGQVVALIAHCDTVTYHALQVGMIRAGLIPFPMSPRMPVAAVAYLMQKTSCHRIVSQPAFASLTSGVKSQLEAKQWAVQVDDCPEFSDIYPDFNSGNKPLNCTPYMKSSRALAMDDIALYMHSSGSTGMPKPIPHRHITSIQWGHNSLFADARKLGVIWGAMPLPPFHSFAFQIHLISPLVSGYPVGLYAPKPPAAPVVPTPQNMLAACKAVGINTIPIVPAFVEAWARSDEDIAYLKGLLAVGYSGGPLSTQTGQKLQAAGVKLYAVYGSTELGTPSTVFDIDDSQGLDNPHAKTSADWQWMRFPDRLNIRWSPQGDGSYELQVLSTEKYSASVENLMDGKGYATRDLFVPHPSKPGMWKTTGRQDDVIVLGSGEKVVPLPQEGVLLANATVPLTSAVMFGRGKNQCGVLLEIRPGHDVDGRDAEALSNFRNRIWPVVEEANQHAPTFARIYKEMIIVADPKRPLPRAAKGTIVRAQALALYQADIEELYSTVEKSANIEGVDPPTSWSVDSVKEWLATISASLKSGASLDATVDLFEQGFDSVDATFLRNRIVAMLKSSAEAQAQLSALHIPQNFVFENPTIQSLASTLSTMVTTGADLEKSDTPTQIRRMVENYSQHMIKPVASAQGNHSQPEGAVILLTGDTGSVGVYILAALLAEEKVRKIYTLSRPSSGGDKRRQMFVERGLNVALLASEKLVELIGDVTKDGFGLSQDVINDLKVNITHIIHNAWRVDYNLSASSFEPYIAGVRRFIDFACLTPRPVKLLFTSSISATISWNFSQGLVPEEPLTDPAVAAGTWYGASKFIAENLLAKAVENGLECTSLRVGQTTGALPRGAWATTEWVPIMVKSSLAFGKLPDLDGLVSWIPMSAVASAVRDVVVSAEPLPPLLNVVHPYPVPWHAVMADLKAAIGSDLPIVPYSEWLKSLEEVAASPSAKDMQLVPAVHLLEYFRSIGERAYSADVVNLQDKSKIEAGGIALFDTRKLQKVCPSVKDLPKIDAELVSAWVAWWKASGWISISPSA